MEPRLKLRTANLFGALATAVTGQLAEAAKSHPNQTDTGTAALNLIALFEGCSNNDLSRALQLSHSATVRLIDKLEADGLVMRCGADDRRAVALHLTASGKRKTEAALKARCIALSDLVEHLSDAQRAALDDIAATLLKHMTQSRLEAAHICRLCNHVACPEVDCPVHKKALELLTAA
jgi:MarR family transcriptional repressor of emrRAB